MAILSGRSCRVFIGDREISEICRGFEVMADVGSAVSLRLDLVAGMSFIDGVLRIDAPRRWADAEPDPALRGITFGAIPAQ